MLVVAAARISIGWTIGVLLPFGPTFFRLKYPDEARDSMWFRYATLIFAAGFFWAAQDSNGLAYYKRRMPRPQPPKETQPTGYAMEKLPPTPAATPTLDERRAANEKTFEKLRWQNEALQLRKRDLLLSDVQGNRQYVVDLALYNQALTQAAAERQALSQEK